jgi:heat-inducible transcriptional repressor
MRVLKEEAAKLRKEAILRWIIQEFTRIKKPIGSELISKKGKFNLSSASIRNIMKELEHEGYLHQPHTSGGRIPTDKAYRFYVNYLSEVQKLAVNHRENIEKQYRQQTDEVDKLMIQTSKTLAMLSRSAGFVFSSNIYEQTVKRIDFISLGMRSFLVILVTSSGAGRHLPVSLNYEISPQRLRILSAFLNHEISGLSLNQAQRRLYEYIDTQNRELKDTAYLAMQFLEHIGSRDKNERDLHIEGVSQLLKAMSETENRQFLNMLNVMEDKHRFAKMLSEKLSEHAGDFSGKNTSGIKVTIGSENELKELQGLSMVSCTYKIGKKAVGLLGILGPRHMQYSKMISLVNYISGLMEKTLHKWDELMLNESCLELGFDDDDKEI